MTLPLTKSQVRKLGDKLRAEAPTNNYSQESLLRLQELRVSHKKNLSDAFQILANESRKVRKSRVVTYRIKRIESIISKLKRYPSMELDRMIDIAGCRCIVDSVSEIYQLRDILKKSLIIFDERDYIKRTPPDGYKALHLYVYSDPEKTKSIEIQIRTRRQHNWATFVEIIDVLYDVRIKEGEKHPDLEKFCLLFSRVDELNPNEKIELLEIEIKYGIYSKLGEVFNQNNIQVRQLWISIEETKGNNFFIIEVDENKKPHFYPFKTFEVAEGVYFQKFNTAKTNIVLTHLEKPTYKSISTAYSNYILSMHQFQEELCEIASDTIIFLSENKNVKKAEEISSTYNNYVDNEVSKFNEEIKELKESSQVNDKMYEWITDMGERLANREEIISKSQKKLEVGLEFSILLFLPRLIRKMFRN